MRLALEALEDGGAKRPGRPPKWLVEARRRLSDTELEDAAG